MCTHLICCARTSGQASNVVNEYTISVSTLVTVLPYKLDHINFAFGTVWYWWNGTIIICMLVAGATSAAYFHM